MIPTKESKQQTYCIDRHCDERVEAGSSGDHFSEIRAVLPGVRHGDPCRDDGSRCANGLRAASWSRYGSPSAPLGEDEKGKIGFHGGKVEIERPPLRRFDGKEYVLPSWEATIRENWLGKWAINQMLINVSIHKFARSVRLLEGDARPGRGRHRERRNRPGTRRQSHRARD
jgi:putative transposase